MIGWEDGRYTTNQIDFLLNGKYISNSNTIANNFNNYFINVGSSLPSSIQSENDPLGYFQINNNYIHIPERNKVEIKSTISSRHLYSNSRHMFIRNLVTCYIIILFNAFINHIHKISVMTGNRHNIITSYKCHITSPGIPASTVKSRKDN